MRLGMVVERGACIVCVSFELMEDNDVGSRRMKGVVKPQAIPTSRKPRVQRRMEGCGSGRGGSASILRVFACSERMDPPDQIIEMER